MRMLAGGLFAIGLGLTAIPEPVVIAAGTCDVLARLALPHATVTVAQPVEAGAFKPDAQGESGDFTSLPAFCRVAATLKPTSDSDIKMEVWLPASGWNGKFQAVGNGAFSGSIAYPAMGRALGARLRDGVHRHRACRQHRQLRAGAPGETRSISAGERCTR